MTSDGDGDRPRTNKSSKSIAKKKSRTPIDPNDTPGRLSSQPWMHTSSSGRSYVPYDTGNPADFHGPRKQSQPLHISASHTIRPTDIRILRLSSATPSPRDSSPHLS